MKQGLNSTLGTTFKSQSKQGFRKASFVKFTGIGISVRSANWTWKWQNQPVNLIYEKADDS